MCVFLDCRVCLKAVKLLDNSGNTVVKYVYDAWGNHEIIDYTSYNLGQINPIRYRSYYFDTETGLYYLQSRYYDPEVGRFISMDDIDYLDPETIGGTNLYAYCNNNPVMYVDPTGHAWYDVVWDWVNTIAGFLNPISTVTAIGALATAMIQGRWDDIKSDWDNGCFNPFNQNEDNVLKARVLSFYKGSTVVRQSIVGTCSIFGTIWFEPGLGATTLRHEYGHSIQERILGVSYLSTIAIPSVLNYFYGSDDNKVYYSLPWERTADWLGGVRRGSDYYKKGALTWGIAENLLGPIVIPFYYLFGY